MLSLSIRTRLHEINNRIAVTTKTKCTIHMYRKQFVHCTHIESNKQHRTLYLCNNNALSDAIFKCV